ncbi:DUF1896 family protein [Prevotella sp. oral taxon 475]|nr:DUF1896 family protein [Prevotella sp. oral taxon 475]
MKRCQLIQYTTTARADKALTTYCDAIAQGFSHPKVEVMASEVLYQGLHFPKYDTIVSVLEKPLYFAPFGQTGLLTLAII